MHATESVVPMVDVVPTEKHSSIVSKPETEVSAAILAIVFEYALNKFDDTMDRLAKGVPKFMSVIEAFVKDGKRVEMCLPAFPFKSANKVYKVLGALPDKAEELALGRLHDMCERIEEIYSPGAHLTIISDGIVYNDLLCIPDREVWFYGEALRAMAIDKGFTNIGFSRLRDLAHGMRLPDKLEQITYVANATNFRRFLMNKYGKDDIDIDWELENNRDTHMTYCGYKRFLQSDLQYIYPNDDSEGGMSRKKYKANIKYLAREMLIRGYAFAGACKAAFPNHLRLSIHQSTGEHKVSMSLLNTRTGFTTPWHCAVARMEDGEWVSAPSGEFQQDKRLRIVEENGRPSYYELKEPKTGESSEVDDGEN